MRIALAVAALLTGCSEPRPPSNSADVGAAATAAQNDIDQYAAERAAAAGRAAPGSEPAPAARPSVPVVPAETDDDGAQAAADVVRRFYARVAARDYAAAYRRLDGSPLSLRDFAAGFAPYASYRAEVGPPGRVDAGAGQRYVTVPVRIAAVAATDGRPVTLSGALTLHRTADIDGATAAQRSWQIRDIALRPGPATAAGPAAGPASCAGVTRSSERDDADGAVWRQDEPAAPCTAAK